MNYYWKPQRSNHGKDKLQISSIQQHTVATWRWRNKLHGSNQPLAAATKYYCSIATNIGDPGYQPPATDVLYLFKLCPYLPVISLFHPSATYLSCAINNIPSISSNFRSPIWGILIPTYRLFYHSIDTLILSRIIIIFVL